MEAIDIAAARRRWEVGGYLILPGFYSQSEIDDVAGLSDDAWARLSDRIVVDDLVTNRRSLMREVAAEARRTHSFKINDLYLEYPAVRSLALGHRLGPVLQELLRDVPVLCNSLNFDRGSQQPNHMDSLYMTPKTKEHLVATWIALEDCHSDAGPLRYYPGSHRIDPYRFSDGSYHAIDAEMPGWDAYIESEVQRLGLKPETFPARKGDVFVWHSHLIHGGSAIADQARTRKSLVCHYFSLGDARAQRWRVARMDGGYWLCRKRQPVPEDPPPGLGRRLLSRLIRKAQRLLP